MGTSILSCGHPQPAGMSLDETAVRYRSEACDAIEGFHRVVVHATFCDACQRLDWFLEAKLETEEEGDAWLLGDEADAASS